MISQNSKVVVIVGLVGVVMAITVGISQIVDGFTASDLEMAQIEDKLHENLVTRIKNMSLIMEDSCKKNSNLSDSISEQLSEALLQTTVHKNFSYAEEILERIAYDMKLCDDLFISPSYMSEILYCEMCYNSTIITITPSDIDFVGFDNHLELFPISDTQIGIKISGGICSDPHLKITRIDSKYYHRGPPYETKHIVLEFPECMAPLYYFIDEGLQDSTEYRYYLMHDMFRDPTKAYFDTATTMSKLR